MSLIILSFTTYLKVEMKIRPDIRFTAKSESGASLVLSMILVIYGKGREKVQILLIAPAGGSNPR
jgi:hypothetical protein